MPMEIFMKSRCIMKVIIAMLWVKELRITRQSRSRMLVKGMGPIGSHVLRKILKLDWMIFKRKGMRILRKMISIRLRKDIWMAKTPLPIIFQWKYSISNKNEGMCGLFNYLLILRMQAWGCLELQFLGETYWISKRITWTLFINCYLRKKKLWNPMSVMKSNQCLLWFRWSSSIVFYGGLGLGAVWMKRTGFWNWLLEVSFISCYEDLIYGTRISHHRKHVYFVLYPILHSHVYIHVSEVTISVAFPCHVHWNVIVSLWGKPSRTVCKILPPNPSMNVWKTLRPHLLRLFVEWQCQ